MTIKQNKTLFRLLSTGLAVGATLLGILLFFNQAIFSGRFAPLPDSYAGEHQPILTKDLLPPARKSVGTPWLNTDGTRVLLTTEDENKNRYLSLWEEGAGFADLTDTTLTLKGAPAFSANGLRAIFFAGERENKTASLFIWEEGFGINKIPFGEFTGDWILTMALGGHRAILLPNSGAAFSGELHHIQADGTATLVNEKNSSGLLLEFLATIEPNNTKGTAVGPYRLRLSKTAISAGDFQAGNLSGGTLNTLATDNSLNRVAIRPQKNIDLDGDGLEDYLLFAHHEDFPLWKVFSTGYTEGTHTSRTASATRWNSWRAGAADGIPVPGDYNGDGVTDLATYRPGESKNIVTNEVNWQIYLSKAPALMGERAPAPTGGRIALSWGFGDDIPVPADYDGDGTTDIGVFNRELGQWFLLFARGGFNITKGSLKTPGFGAAPMLGSANSQPTVADYNGDGRADPAVWDPPEEGEKNGTWRVLYLDLDGREAITDNSDQEDGRKRYMTFGQAGDIPIAADYNCDGRAEPGVYRPSEKMWIIRYGERKIERIPWGWPGAEKTSPIVGDYDGDGCVDIGLFIPDGFLKWYIRSSRFAPNAETKMPNGLNIVTSSSSGIEGGLPPQVWQRNLSLGN